MSTTDERKVSSTGSAYMPETQGVAAKPQQKANEAYRDGGDIQTRDSGDNTGKKENNDEAYRDGGDIQTRDSGNNTALRKDNDEAYRDGGDIQTRGPNTAPDAQTIGSSSSQDDVERSA